ncbi:probable receptor-like protein kinase At1g30570 [Cynara cardunculus var. scolymus]|uniref:probable receptor-like protein kinase At1g30570 n=1 Tax=Cynara cardunculus var. scolymus TaxID=59895 RepID=UPI000D629A3A|nr:probable receptor-like protein kinase At1g30570 [Cynara cardunculus var. scolymus]
MMHVTKQFHHIQIQLEAIISATNNFSDDNCIGNGGFGKVYKGELLHSERQTVVAVKRLNRAFGQGDPEFWKEIIMLSRYKHENIVSLLGFCDESGEKILVYEYASKKSLDLYLNSEDLTWIQRLKICIGAARGLAYLHNPGGTQQRVLHRDIKSSNILLDENWNARISDLGLSKFGPANQQITFLVSNAVGTIGYCDPVYVETGVLTKESDVYSFGVMLFEVLCGRLCIGNNNDKYRPLTGLARQCYEQNKINEIIYRNIKDEIKPRSLKAFTAIAYQCLKRDLEERPLMTKVVRILERALQHQGDANSPADYDSDDEDVVESDFSPLDGGTSRNHVAEKRLTMNMRLKELRERVKKQQEVVEEKRLKTNLVEQQETELEMEHKLKEIRHMIQSKLALRTKAVDKSVPDIL